MEPEAAAITLSQAMTQTTDPYALGQLAEGLSAAVARMDPKSASATLGQSMARTTDAHALERLAQRLSLVALSLESSAAAAVCGQAAVILSQAMIGKTDHTALEQLARGLWAVAARMDPMVAASTISQALTQTTDPYAQAQLERVLSAVLHGDDSWGDDARRHGLIAAVGTLNSPRSVLPAVACLQVAAEPPPQPLPAQALVELLKQPFCVGEARRLVLQQLSRRYQRPFADVWDFVHFAKEQNLGLDFTTPPRRPEMSTGRR